MKCLLLNYGKRNTEMFSSIIEMRYNLLKSKPCILGVLVIVGLLLAILVLLYRRGHMKPLRRGLEAASVKYRKSMAGFAKRGYQRRLVS